MTTELEQEFFRVFGINKQCICPYFPEYKESGCGICIKYFQGEKDCNKKNQYKYPDITAEKLLEMICILNETACEVLAAENIGDLKNEILETCIKVYNTPILTSDGDEYDNYAIYDKIQQLFKEQTNKK